MLPFVTHPRAGCTPLHFTALTGAVDAAHLLLASGADAARRNCDGVTAVDIARAEGNTPVVRLLTQTHTKASR